MRVLIDECVDPRIKLLFSELKSELLTSKAGIRWRTDRS